MPEEHFSILERYGENYTEKEYVTNPAIGRDEQLKELLIILLTPEKSAILIGYPGTGKTAIVEGLAYKIQHNDVPDALKGYTIINIKTASLLGTMPNGESKVQLMIDELKEKEKIILFIDEIHMLIGSTDESSLDFANIFKEGLGRGSIKVIGATTTAEYERYILRDKAFVRRFQKIEVPEPTRDETVNICIGTLPKIEKGTGVRLKYSKYQQRVIMEFLTDFTSEYKRVFEANARYPDVTLTILKSAFSFAVFDNRKEVNIYDFEKAIENTHLVYPDVIKKELPIFKEKFKDMYDEENGIIKEGIILPNSRDTNNTMAMNIERPTTSNIPNIDMSLMDGIILDPVNTVNNTVSTPTQSVAAQVGQDYAQISNRQQVVEQPVAEQQPVYNQYQNVNASIVSGYDNTSYINPGMIANTRRETLESPQKFDNTKIDGMLINNPVSSNNQNNIDLDLNSDNSNDFDDFYE